MTSKIDTQMLPADLESLDRLREATARWVVRERTRTRCVSGLASLDALLQGGWPAGRVAELLGARSSGRSGVAVSTLAAATARGEVVCWIDLPDAFDPVSARDAGLDLERLLWIRPQRLEEAVRAAELVLDVCGFTVLVLDVGDTSAALRGRPRAERERAGTLRLRLARSVERSGAVALVLAERPWVGTMAGVSLAFGPAEARWGGEEGRPRWLESLEPDARLDRVRGRAPEPHVFRERAAGE